jgi:uncharacterized BrkB/YihY/UPF0761 family membrane protein
MSLRRWFGLATKFVRTAIDGFMDDELMTRAAALSFYSALSFAPLPVLLLWVAVCGSRFSGEKPTERRCRGAHRR